MRRVRNTTQRKKVVKSTTTPNISTDIIKFDLNNELWLKGVTYKDFTNKLQSESQYCFEITNILVKIFPTIIQNSDEILYGGGRGFHCHPVKERDDEYILVMKIIEKIYGTKFIENIETQNKLYQLGVDGGQRIFALRDSKTNTFKPLFVDYHHLAYPSIKFNQTDYLKKDFCPLAAIK